MKLYATTTSERASKGQGGNDFIDALITLDKKEIVQVQVKAFPECYRITYRIADGKAQEVFLQSDEQKGNKQKGD